MNVSNVAFFMDDYGGRRSGVERRIFHYSDYIPERRTNQDRRSGKERRSGKDRRAVVLEFTVSREKRNNTDRRRGWNVISFK